MTVIDDVVSELSTNYNTTQSGAIVVRNQAEIYTAHGKNARNKEVVYVSNPDSRGQYVDNGKEFKDTEYDVVLDITSKTDAQRDNLFNECHRIIEASGVTNYENRYAPSYSQFNAKNSYGAQIRFTIIKLKEKIAR